jgi:adenylyltransferase/sulfurtransferase
MTIIDPREPHAWQMANRARSGARLIPRGPSPQRLSAINPADDMVVPCKVGGRSAQAYEILQHTGYTRIKHLKGCAPQKLVCHVTDRLLQPKLWLTHQ